MTIAKNMRTTEAELVQEKNSGSDAVDWVDNARSSLDEAKTLSGMLIMHITAFEVVHGVHYKAKKAKVKSEGVA